MLKLRHMALGIPTANTWLHAQLAHAPDVPGLILVLDAPKPAGSEHLASLGQQWAARLQRHGYATLCVRLLGADELARDPEQVYSIPLLAQRLAGLLTWLEHQAFLNTLPLALLSQHTFNAAALRVLAQTPKPDCLICLGSQAGLAGRVALQGLTTPCSWITCRHDPALAAQLHALEYLQVPYSLLLAEQPSSAPSGEGLIPGPDCPGVWEQVADWLKTHLPERQLPLRSIA